MAIVILLPILMQLSVKMELLLYKHEIIDTLVLHDPQQTEEDAIIRIPTLVGPQSVIVQIRVMNVVSMFVLPLLLVQQVHVDQQMALR